MSRGALLAILVAAVGWRTAPVAGQASQPSGDWVAYTDPSFGFELRVPNGWEYDRTRFQPFKDCVGLLRGRDPAGRRGLQVMVFRSFPMPPFEEWIVDFGRSSAELLNSPRTDWETWRLPPRAGAILTYTSKLGAVTTRGHYLCLPFDPNTVWVLTYTGAISGEAEQPQVRSEFEQIIGSLKVHYDPEEAERLAPAYDRGRALIGRLRGQPKLRLDEDRHFYEVGVAGRPVGYLERRIAREEYVFSAPDAKRRYAKDGVRVRERSWRFAEDGTVLYGRLDLFSSLDLRSELMENEQMQLPPAGVAGEPLVRTEKVVREDGVLYASGTTSRDTGLPDPGKPIEVGPVYLDQAWARLLPGLLLSEQDMQPVAVAVYNFDTRALVSHQIVPRGERPLEGFEGPTFVFEVREGFIAQPGTLWCDERGTLLKLDTRDLTLTRMGAAEIERKYGPRRDAARERYKIVTD